jgi:aerobic carbon-monoxide dehydrogenase medium subunit
MKSAPFDYHAPSTLDEAVQLLDELDDAKVLGGGQSFIPLLAMRLAVFEHVVDLRLIEELRGIEVRDGEVWIGASTTQATAEHHRGVALSVPLLARALPLIGHFQIRNRGTIGGSLAHADPASELPAVTLALDATFEAVSVRGRRTIPAAEFFLGTWSTALDDDEVLAAVRFPIWAGRCGYAIEEVARRHGDFAIAGAVVGVELDAEDRIARCAIGLIGLGSTPERAGAAEADLTGRPVNEVDPVDVGRLATAGLTSIPEDLHGSATYRARVGAEMVARAWTTAVAEARDA